MQLSKKIRKSAIKIELESSTKDEVLEELVDLLCSAYKLKERDAILKAIINREQKQSTGIGSGLAVPHAKTSVVDRLCVAFGRSSGGIDFDSIDQAPTHIFFILISRRDVSGPHIKALAGISRLLAHDEFRQGLLACPDEKAFMELVKSGEKKYL